jgi:hypothetical protein
MLGNYVHSHLGYFNYIWDVYMWYQAADQQLDISIMYIHVQTADRFHVTCQEIMFIYI